MLRRHPRRPFACRHRRLHIHHRCAGRLPSLLASAPHPQRHRPRHLPPHSPALRTQPPPHLPSLPALAGPQPARLRVGHPRHLFVDGLPHHHQASHPRPPSNCAAHSARRPSTHH